MDKKQSEEKSPRPTDVQKGPQPVRPLNTQEEAGQSIQEMEDPPQAEGDRKSAER